MRHVLFAACLLLAGCGSSAAVHGANAPTGGNSAVADGPLGDDGAARSGTWIGASAESEMLFDGDDSTMLGVWVDVPRMKTKTRAPVDLALVIDTSGSMTGQKLEHARATARMLIDNLADGDIVSIDTFNNEAESLSPPTVLNAASRADLARTIAGLRVGGSTNLFDGLALGESHVARAPASHGVRRVVVISDGIANVGPSSPDALGQLAERGLRFRAQVTSVGIGLDYDERTLNALAVRSSGRLYHVAEPEEMTAMLRHELELLQSTVASDAFIEIVPAPTVQLTATDMLRTERTGDGALRIPLGALFSGQHREALVHARFSNATPGTAMPASTRGEARPLASVRLHFRDPDLGDVERVQEMVARVAFTNDAEMARSHANAKTQAIMAVQEAAKLQMEAAQEVNRGDFASADKKLAEAQTRVAAQASSTKDAREKKRLTDEASGLGSARASTSAAAAAPKAAQRSEALKLNKGGMSAAGF
jgi:Ca-activated chloride channel family protein